jgi:prohibitin 2
VLPSIVNEVTKAVVAQYNASELLTKRDLVSKQIREMLIKRSGDFQILLDDVSITHLAFSKEYTAAVEAKQVAQQDSERAKYIVERAIQEKRTIVIHAEGEAQSAQLIGAAIRGNPAFIQLRRIEAAKEVRGRQIIVFTRFVVLTIYVPCWDFTIKVFDKLYILFSQNYL